MEPLLQMLIDPQTHTQEALCRALNLTPEALLTQIQLLKTRGYDVRVSAEGSVILAPVQDSLLPAYILQALSTRELGRTEVLYAPQMDSTNTVLKQAALTRVLPHGSLAVCDRQTAGKGRLQREWDDSAAGASLTCSVLLRPGIPPEKLPLVTLAAAVAAARAIAQYGLQPGIKWPNDIVLGTRKCVGILCETATDPAGERCVIAGTGFNVKQTAFPEALQSKATSLALEGAKDVSRLRLLCDYLTYLETVLDALKREGLNGILAQYTANSVTLGRRVQVLGMGETFTGTANRIDESGALYVTDDAGAVRRVLSGDVSVRGVMGYV